jgi:hypothetical protein
LKKNPFNSKINKNNIYKWKFASEKAVLYVGDDMQVQVVSLKRRFFVAAIDRRLLPGVQKCAADVAF